MNLGSALKSLSPLKKVTSACISLSPLVNGNLQCFAGNTVEHLLHIEVVQLAAFPTLIF